MRLISHDDDIVALRQHRKHFFTLFRCELLHGREDNATGRPVQQLAQIISVIGLSRRLADQVLAEAESAEELII